MPARLAVVTLLLLVGCTSVSPTPTPTRSASAPPTASLAPSPSASAPGKPADLTVTASGYCGGAVVANLGGCQALMLLEPSADTDFSDRDLADEYYEFEMGERTEWQIFLTGRLLDGPTTLHPGHWTVGLGERNSSDLAEQPDWLSVNCYRPFTVEPGTLRVEIRAQFLARCGIEILIDGVPQVVACVDDTFYGLEYGGRDLIQTEIYLDEHLVTVTVFDLAEPTFVETATLDFTDPECLEHRLIGPIVRGVVHGFEPPPGERAELVGRLFVPNIGVGCSVLIDRDGLTWDMGWPDGYEPTFATTVPPGLVGPDGNRVADAGDLIGVKGHQMGRDRSHCIPGTGFRAEDIIFVSE